jgi:hypothetical protein
MKGDKKQILFGAIDAIGNVLKDSWEGIDGPRSAELNPRFELNFPKVSCDLCVKDVGSWHRARVTSVRCSMCVKDE